MSNSPWTDDVVEDFYSIMNVTDPAIIPGDRVGGYCEDYPACGHTPQDPCQRQWYDEPDAFDLTKNPHALCDHENGECDVEYYDDDLDEEGL